MNVQEYKLLYNQFHINILSIGNERIKIMFENQTILIGLNSLNSNNNYKF